MKGVLNYLLSFIPTALPTGMTEFKAWSDSILAMSEVPDNDSTRFAVAVMIMHLDSTTDRKAKRFFIKALNKSAANEIANGYIVRMKEAQKARIAAEEAKKQLESNLSAGDSQDAKIEEGPR